MTKKRDRSYYEERLRKEHPGIYRDFRAGKFSSVRAAAISAGLIRQPTRVGALKREWRGASAADKVAFLKWLKSGTAKSTSGTVTIAMPDGRLKASVVSALLDWLKSTRSRPGRIMKEIGGSNYDYRMSAALFQCDPLPEPILEKLALWMRRQRLS
ncbi:hypothetical protein [Pseudolabrys sp. Root1462]|uniref:hypothetical protein n=1 Tax=Pseudolabrys sp. Root1462 TaxID=1736466 RepID=UPI0012E3E635|nr:hypothetical protein [Pseudolabrys sp. Root1462]